MAALQIENAVKAFKDTAVLNGVSLELNDGEFCLLISAVGTLFILLLLGWVRF